MNRAPIPSLVLVAIIGLVLAACGAGATTDDGIAHPTASDEPILVVSQSGGFVPPQFMATQLPPFVLLGDGRVIVQGAQTLIFPGPMLPPLMERRLSEAGIQQVLEAVAETGLFDEDLRVDGAQNMVADASDTVFTLDADGRDVTVSIYAMGTFAGEGAIDTPPDMEITEAEVAADRTLQGLYDRLISLDTWLGEDAWADEAWRPYEASAYRIYARDNTEEEVDGGGVAPTLMEWPETSTDPASFGEAQATFGDGTRCGVVEGDEAEAWSEQLSVATQLTFWTDAEHERRYHVGARPLLPHEEATCPELIGA